MTTTAMQMIAQARSPGRYRDPRGRRRGADLRRGPSPSMSVSPRNWQHGHIDGSVAAPRGLLEFLADPTTPRHKAHSTPPGEQSWSAPPAPEHHSPRSPSRQWATRTWPSSTAASRDGSNAGLPTTEHEYSGI